MDELARRPKSESPAPAKPEDHVKNYFDIDFLTTFGSLKQGVRDEILGCVREQMYNHNEILKNARAKAFVLDIMGNILAYLSVLTICLTGYFFMINNHPTQGASIIISVAIGLAAVFIVKQVPKGKQVDKDEKQE